jgi:hypothetical protein
MDQKKSLDKLLELIDALLHDVQTSHGAVFNTRSRNLTLKKIKKRASQEGISFLTKTLPRFGKALDRALSGGAPLNAQDLRSKPYTPGSKLPKLFGELISCVLSSDGTLLPNPCTQCVRSLRMLSYCLYKYELPYEDDECAHVIQKFEKTEDDLRQVVGFLQSCKKLHDEWKSTCPRVRHQSNTRLCSGSFKFNGLLRELEGLGLGRNSHNQPGHDDTCSEVVGCKSVRPKGIEDIIVQCELHRCDRNPGGLDMHRRQYVSFHHIRKAQHLLSDVFAFFDPKNITPRHGPGAVATKQQLWSKFRWTNVSANITRRYPLDEYFYSSLGAVCDMYKEFDSITEEDLPARVVLVPKDSRGPRLISCEPVDYQWIQQGLGRAIVAHVEKHPLTREHVFFTSQQTNQFGALLGSSTGEYSTLDLNEASDRVTVELVRLLFPAHICEYLEACRSSSTRLPDGRVLPLVKFAPMGSCLCFPIMALTIWAILTAGADDAYTRDRIAVYGDDVIVTAGYTANAIEQLESFGLKINRDKSCTGGLFRESCGMDAFKGINVTPVRFRTVWSSEPSPDVYYSWIAYANSCYDRHYYHTYDKIVSWLHHVYGDIPDDDMSLKAYPSLRVVTEDKKPKYSHWNVDLQKREHFVRVAWTPSISRVIPGWSMLLRYFSEAPILGLDTLARVDQDGSDSEVLSWEGTGVLWSYDPTTPIQVRLYTRRRSSMLEWRWR